jgi:hypothetical protein
LRLPNDWNGRLVVAGASGTRSEFNGDFAWSDFVVQKGYAYASQNKGVLNLQFTTAADPLDAGSTLFAIVRSVLRQSGRPALHTLGGVHGEGGGDRPRRREVGIRQLAPVYLRSRVSNGGYQVRRALEEAPKLFDGGVDWEGTFVDEPAPNLLTDLPPAILNFPDYVTSGFDANSTFAKNIRAAGYPPDIVAGAASLWLNHSNSYWEVTACQWQKRLDPTYDTYGSGLGTYNYCQPAFVLGRGRANGSLRQYRNDQRAADHRRRHNGRAFADRSPRPCLRSQSRSGARRWQSGTR